MLAYLRHYFFRQISTNKLIIAISLQIKHKEFNQKLIAQTHFTIVNKFQRYF
jgi:hypothetical protein